MADNQLARESNPRPGAKPGVIPQHRKQGTQQFEDTEGTNGALHTKIVDVNGNPIYTVPVQLTGSNMELYGLSTDTKPTTNLVVGTSFFEIDTTDAYMWDGTQWRLI